MILSQLLDIIIMKITINRSRVSVWRVVGARDACVVQFDGRIHVCFSRADATRRYGRTSVRNGVSVHNTGRAHGEAGAGEGAGADTTARRLLVQFL